MSHHAHSTQHSRGAATKNPLAYVRTVQEKRKPLGWLECSADEFFRLLTLHSAGKINLLAMPETSADTLDDEPEEDEREDVTEQPPAPSPLAPPSAVKRGTLARNKASAGVVRQVVASADRPLTVIEIAHKAKLSPAAVRAAIRRGKTFFQCAGLDEDGHTKLWGKKV